MAFQVVISTFRRTLSAVESVFTDSERTVICEIYITLEAVVEGDLTGHTFEWEQTSGSPVSWVGSRFQPIVTYSQITKNDKTFTFWVDRGTALEQIRYVTVYGTPIDTNIVKVETSLYGFQPWITSNEEPITFSLVPGEVSLNDDLSFWGYLPEALSWSEPSGSGKDFYYATLEENSTGQFIEIGRVYYPNPLIFLFSPSANKSYRARNFFKTSGVINSSLSITRQFPTTYYLYASANEQNDIKVNTPGDYGFTTTYTSRQLRIIGDSNPEFLEQPDIKVNTPGDYGFTTIYTLRQLRIIGDSNPEFLEQSAINVGTPSDYGFTINIIARNSSTIGG